MYYEDIKIHPIYTVPYKLLINQINIIPYHWHDFIEIIFGK